MSPRRRGEGQAGEAGEEEGGDGAVEGDGVGVGVVQGVGALQQLRDGGGERRIGRLQRGGLATGGGDGGVAVGISTSGPRQADAVRRALEVEVGGAPLFTSFQSTWNVLETSVAPALAQAARAGRTVIVKEPVANGRLVPGTDDPSPAVGFVVALAGQLGVGVDAVAIAAALAQPWATRVLSGAVTPEQVRSNAAAADVVLPPDALHVLAGLAEEPDAYWAARSRRSWT